MIDKETFILLYNQGLSDTKISKILHKCRKEVSKLRKALDLPRTTLTTPFKPKIAELVALGYSDLKIAKILNISKSEIQRIRKQMKLKTNFIQRTYANKTDRRKGLMLRNIKFSAKKRNIVFNLDYSDLELPKYCPILNIKLSYGFDPNSLNNASVDRIDNSKGYIKGNIIIMSRLANLMKNQASLDELQLFSDKIQILINHYKIQGALGSITDIFPDIEMYQEI